MLPVAARQRDVVLLHTPTPVAKARRRHRLLRFDLIATVLAVAVTTLVMYPLGTTLWQVLVEDGGLGATVDAVRRALDW